VNCDRGIGRRVGLRSCWEDGCAHITSRYGSERKKAPHVSGDCTGGRDILSATGVMG
jgi:hypothetical protein